MDTIIDDRGF